MLAQNFFTNQRSLSWRLVLYPSCPKKRLRHENQFARLRNNRGHLSLYYDAGGMFDIELNAEYLQVTGLRHSRKFGSGWEIGGYATLTDVLFETFGEGSDKAIYISIPIDWIVSSPNRSKRVNAPPNNSGRC